jgi:hypothetical protein
MPRAMSVCPCVGCSAHAGSCPTLVTSGRCPECSQVVDLRRGRRQQRGYGAEHDRIRADLLARFVPGTSCPKCRQPMLAGQRLDAGHSTDLRRDPQAKADQLEHATCNRGWRRGEGLR